MLSLSKLILLGFVIAVVWFGWRWVQRVEAIGRARNANGGKNPAQKAAGPGPAATRGPNRAQDMEKCRECGAYVVPDSATPCGRAGCPYGR